MSKRVPTGTVVVIVLAACALATSPGSRAQEPAARLDVGALPRIELPEPAAWSAQRGAAKIQASFGDMRRATEPTMRFVDDYLTPKLERQMDSVAPAHPALPDSTQMIDYVLYDELVDSAERGTRRAVRRAVTDYFIENTSLQTLIGTVKGKADVAGRHGSSFDVGVGVAHWMPEVELRFRGANQSLRFRVGLEGSAGISFGHRALTNTRIQLGWNAREDRLNLGLRFAF